MMVLGWPIGSTFAARSFGRLGLRAILLGGSVLLPAGAVAFLLLRPGMSPVVAGAGSAVVGLGMGLLSTAAIVLIQDSVGWSERGAATASNIFARNLGSTMGATALGAVLNYSLSRATGTSVDFDGIRRLLNGEAVPGGTGLRLALGGALHLTFTAMFLVAVLTVLLAMFVPQVHARPGTRAATAD